MNTSLTAPPTQDSSKGMEPSCSLKITAASNRTGFQYVAAAQNKRPTAELLYLGAMLPASSRWGGAINALTNTTEGPARPQGVAGKVAIPLELRRIAL